MPNPICRHGRRQATEMGYNLAIEEDRENAFSRRLLFRAGFYNLVFRRFYPLFLAVLQLDARESRFVPW